MASGLNLTLVLGTVAGAPRLIDARNGQKVLLMFIDHIEHGLEDKMYTTRYRGQVWGEDASALAESIHDGDRRLFIGTIEPPTIYNDANGNPARSNDLRIVQVVDPVSQDYASSFLFGNLGGDAKLFEGERPFARVSLATNLYQGKDANGASQQRTIWNNLVLNGKQATGLASYLKKGAFIGAIAQFRPSKPYTAQNGEVRAENQYAVSQIVFGGSSYANGGSSQMTEEDLFAGVGEAAPAEASGPSGAGDLFSGF